jgi:hypothetical protein
MFLAKILSDLETFERDSIIQELLSTKNEVATETLQICFTVIPEGSSFKLTKLTIGKDNEFSISKLLFGLTENFLTVSSSATFIAILKLIVIILRERVN